MMRIGLQGGFGEKGRTSVSVRTPSTCIMLDVGIMVGAHGEDYYPRLLVPASRFAALFVSHAHEDHIGALSWLLAQGYRGPVFMTAETRDQAAATLEQYAEPQDRARFPMPLESVETFRPGDTIPVGDLEVRTGCSGHVVGGVWFSAADRHGRFVYCADVVPESGVFRMDQPPECDLLVLDASYGADPVSGRDRATQIVDWVQENGRGCLLPTPLSGRSLELIYALDMPLAVEAGMREVLEEQIGGSTAFRPGVADILRERLARADDWQPWQPWPDRPLLVHDGMGTAGPSRQAIPRADAEGFPILLTGHLPEGSPAAILKARNRAAWIRMPTHPTAPENVRLWNGCGRPPAIGHSCGPDDLIALNAEIPALETGRRTGQEIVLGGA